jgi:hypothetical protein
MPTRVSKPASLCWLVRGWAMVTFFILGCRCFFFEMTLNCFPQKLGPIKQHLKINKNMNHS